MTANDNITALYGVDSGWAGTVAITGTPALPILISYTPTSIRERRSAIEVALLLIREINQHFTFIGSTERLAVWLDEDGKLVFTSNATRTLALSSVGFTISFQRMGGAGGSTGSANPLVMPNQPHLMQYGPLGGNISAYNAEWKDALTTFTGSSSTPMINNGSDGNARFMYPLADSYNTEPDLENGTTLTGLSNGPYEVDANVGGKDLGRFTVAKITRNMQGKRARIAIYDYELQGAMV